jgi:hypothetical protein
MQGRNSRAGIALAVLVVLSGSAAISVPEGRVQRAQGLFEVLVPSSLRALLNTTPHGAQPHGRKIVPKCSVGIDPNGKPCP